MQKAIGLKKYLKNRYVIAGLVVVAILVLYFIMRGGPTTKIESAIVTTGNVIEQVSVTGKISPIDKADLSFDSGGSISHIYVKVGDKVKKGDLLASLDNGDAVASLASAQAKLDDISRGLRPEELQVEKARVATALAARNNNRSSTMDAVRTGYVQAQAAVVNYADTFFSNPQTANPIIKIYTQSSSIQVSIGLQRLSVTDTLNAWKTTIDVATSSDSASSLITKANTYLVNIKSFLDNLSGIVATLSPSGAGLPQTVIDSYAVTMNTALGALNQAITSITVAKTSLEQAQSAYEQANSDFVLKISGSSDQAIRAQKAAVDSLAAVVAKGRIYSPIDGTVTRVDPSEGEYASPGKSGFAVQSEGTFKIEAYVPEADIAKIEIGNTAEVTLDAYGSDNIFGAIVIFVDPAETVLDGVPTYKVTLHFVQKDTRIRSGMTANTDILTHEHQGVLSIPSRAIITDDNGIKSVRVLNKDGQTFTVVPVKIGLKGSNGNTEIVSGLTAGQKVVTYTK